MPGDELALQADLVDLGHGDLLAVSAAKEGIPARLCQRQQIVDIDVLAGADGSPLIRDFLHILFVGAATAMSPVSDAGVRAERSGRDMRVCRAEGYRS